MTKSDISQPNVYDIDQIRQEAMELIGLGICRARLDGTILHIDHEALKVFDLEGMHEDPSGLAGINISDLINCTETPQTILSEILESTRTRGRLTHIRTNKGSGKWVSLNSRLVGSPETDDQGVDIIIQDVTLAVIRDKKRQIASSLLGIIQDTGQIVAQKRDLGIQFHDVCTQLAGMGGINFAWLVLLDESGRFISSGEAGLGEHFKELTQLFLRGDKCPCVEKALLQSGAMIYRSLSPDCRTCPLEEQCGQTGGGVVIRLEHEDRLYGLLHVTRLQSLSPDNETVSMLTEMANNVSSALYAISLEKNRLKTEEAHRKDQEEGFRAFQASPDAILLYRLSEGDVVNINDSFTRILQYSREDVAGARAIELLGWVNPEEKKEFFAHISEKGSCFGFETNLTKKNGEVLPVLMSARFQQLRGESCILLTIRDLSQFKRAETELKESEEKYRRVIENAHEAIAVFQGGSYKFFNSKFNEITGYSKEDIASIHPREFIHPDDINIARENYLKIINGEVSQSFYEIRSLDKAGEVKWLWVNIVGVSWEDQPAALLFLTDIAERKAAEEALTASEEKYRLLADSLPEAVFEIDPGGRFIFLNNTGLELVGFSKEDLEAGLTIFDLLAEGEKDRISKAFQRSQFSGLVRNLELTIKKKNSAMFPTVIHAVPVVKDGKLSGMRGIAIDMTEIREVEAEKAQIEAQLLQAQKMEAVGTLAGGIAHDFNNLLQAVVGYSDLLLLRRMEHEPGYHEINEINIAAKKGGDLVRQLLTFSRKVESQMRPLDLNDEVSQIETLLRRTLPRMIDIKLELTEDLKAIKADSSQIQQVLMNLGVNARDAMPDGGTLIIKTENVTLSEEDWKAPAEIEPGDYVKISVIDSGQGMDQETLHHAFEPFFTTKDVNQGTGLGLAMVYGIVKNHGGFIECRSRPGQGTVFEMYFPAALSIFTPRKSEIVTPTVVKGRETILLVDDEKQIRELAKELLKDFGYIILTASDGEEALELYKKEKERIDLVILDLIMPGIGGRQCFEELKKIQPEVKVLISSGYSATATTTGTMESGAKGFLSKPYEINQMLQVIRQVLDEE